jgi:hypothetical protein
MDDRWADPLENWLLCPAAKRSHRRRMGFFSKSPKPNPQITFEGIEFTFHAEDEWWEFVYRGIEFCSFGPSVSLPGKAELDAIVDTVNFLQPEMRKRLSKGVAEWGNGKLDEGETFSVNLENYSSDKSFVVTWAEGASWADMGVDFTIRNKDIVDETWGD